MRDGWVKMPMELAGPWYTMPAITRAVGAELFRQWQEEPIQGVSLERFEDAAVRMLSPDKRERKALRNAIRSIIDAGLLVETDAGVRLVYSRATWSEAVRKVDVKGSYGGRKVDASGTQGVHKGAANHAETLDAVLQREREKEREKESAPAAPPTTSVHIAELEVIASARCHARNRARPRGTRDQDRQAAERVREIAALHKVSFAEAAAKLVDAALDASAEKPKEFPFLLLTLDPFASAVAKLVPVARRRALDVPENV